MATRELAMNRVRPFSNIMEQNDAVVLRLEMPGVRKENLELNVENDRMVIIGRRDPMPEEARYVVRERRIGEFFQSYTLDDTIDRNRIDAKLEHGILTVTLHLKESEKPRRIEVKAK